MPAVKTRFTAAAVLAAVLALGAAAGPVAPAYAGRAAGGTASGGVVDVVVRAGSAASAAAAKALVERAGGTVKRELDVIRGFAATVPGIAAAALGTLPGVTVTADAAVRMKDSGWLYQDGATLLRPAIRASGADRADGDDPDDGYTATGVRLTGEGVGVALIDSGVSPVPGLTGAGKVINGPDLSFESQASNLRYLDTYGHGTHMAGIIAGRDPVGGYGSARFDGVAPGAHIISLKVASADGAADVSQVIAAIDWVVEHRTDRDLNIRVLNLSFGTDSTQSSTLDPLAFAVEQAWDNGIVVVVSAGNDGFGANRLTMPAADPDVIAVGAADSRSTETRTDDVVADFSNRGNAERHPDVLAAGSSVVSLRVPGSFIDRAYPSARLGAAGDPAQRFFRGSGTSQAAAMVSGAAALLVQQRPGLTPDQVKRLLMTTAEPIPDGDVYAAGEGQIRIGAATRTRTPFAFRQLNPAATGLGSLESSRGAAHVYDPSDGTVLTGEKDIFGKSWDAPGWSMASRTRNAWGRGGTWNGTIWTGTGFGAATEEERSWTAVTWTGSTWAGATWAGRTWANAYWTGDGWASETWAGRTWAGRTWASDEWTGDR